MGLSMSGQSALWRNDMPRFRAWLARAAALADDRLAALRARLASLPHLPGRMTFNDLRSLPGRVWAMLVRAARHAHDALRGQTVIITVLVCGILGALVSYGLTADYYESRTRQTFETQAGRYAANLGQSIDRYMDVIKSVGAFMAASKEVDRWEFFTMAGRSLPRFPNMRTLQWVPRVAAGDRRSYEAAGQKDGLYGFGFTERDAAGKAVPAGKRREYFPVYYVEPFVGNEDVLGLDLGANPEALQLLLAARDSGQLAARPGNPWSGDADGPPTLVTAFPVYRADKPPVTLRDRRETLYGFVVGMLHVGELLKSAMLHVPSVEAFDIYLYERDPSGAGRLIHAVPSQSRDVPLTLLPESELRDGLHLVADYDVAGRVWSLLIRPADEYYSDSIEVVPLSAGAFCLLLTALLLQSMVSSNNRTRIIESTVAERTLALVEANKALETQMRERERAERQRVELERSLAQIQKMDSLGTLAGGIAHEINTPVQYVGENLEYLREAFGTLGQLVSRHQALADEASDDIDLERELMAIRAFLAAGDVEHLRREIPAAITESQEGIERISQIVRAIREFSHPDTEEKTAADINHLIATTLTVARNQIKYVAEVATDFDDSLPPVPCLPGELQQVILNLLVNAAHAIEDKGGNDKGRIDVTTKALDHYVEIRVSDTGSGIRKSNLAKIFDPFFTTKEPGKGTGQGLAISHTIITKKHGGTISVDSRPGAGTTFVIRLPVTAPAAEASAA